MPEKKKIYWFIFLYFIIAAFPINNIPLFETTEARYAEIAWEMVYHHDFLEPRFNGIKHFHKPPFTYWINALGIKLFGVNGFAVRIFGVLASVLILFVTFKLAKLLLKDYVKAQNSVYILSSSLLFIAVSRIVSTDIYLTLFTVLAQFYLFRQIYGKKSFYNATLYGLFLGLGFITKGPIIFLFTILPYLVAKIFIKSHRKVFSIKEILAGLCIFLIISLPWYIAVIIKNPELLNYFLKVQTVDRVVTNRFHRNKPFYFFILIFIGTFFPYIIIFAKGLWGNIRKISKKEGALYLYIILPFIVFSVAKSKLATYILPFFPLASILVADIFNVNVMKSKYFKIPTLVFLSLLPLVFIVAPFVYHNLVNHYIMLLIFFIINLLMLYGVYKKFTLFNIAIYLIFISFCIYSTLPILGPQIKGYKKMSEKILELDSDGKYKILTYRAFIPSISFYTGKINVAAFGREREVQFEKDNEYLKYYIENNEQLNKFLIVNNELFVVSKTKHINELDGFGFKCEEKFVQRKHHLYFCKR